MKNKPAYAIESVNHALHLAAMLQQEGPFGVSEAAERLGVSRSTAHRLLAMLVYRDFAEQDADRRYRAGPVLRPAEPTAAPVALLRRVARAHLRNLVSRIHETATLQVLVDTQMRFVATVECDQVLRVGDRAGRVLPAHLVSSGKVLLAQLPPDELAQRYAGDDEIDLPRLHRELSLVRRQGFAVNDQLTESGVTAVGVVVPGPDTTGVAGLALAIPSVRFDHDRLPDWVSALRSAAAEIGRDLTESA